MSTIPKEIMDKIEAASKRQVLCSQEWNCEASDKFKKGCEFGYQLATDGREELEKENGYLLASKTIDEKDELIETLKSDIIWWGKRVASLENKVNDLKMDNMTHEYNQAEAEKYFPEYKRQIEEPLLERISSLEAENERLKKSLEFRISRS